MLEGLVPVCEDGGVPQSSLWGLVGLTAHQQPSLENPLPNSQYSNPFRFRTSIDRCLPSYPKIWQFKTINLFYHSFYGRAI